MSKKWHKGPPPSLGWWPASVNRNEGSLRWRGVKDGREYWSVPVSALALAQAAGASALQESMYSDLVEWQDRPASWPARSKT